MNSRDSFTMLLYSRMFDWLVAQINQTLAGDATNVRREKKRDRQEKVRGRKKNELHSQK